MVSVLRFHTTTRANSCLACWLLSYMVIRESFIIVLENYGSSILNLCIASYLLIVWIEVYFKTGRQSRVLLATFSCGDNRIRFGKCFLVHIATSSRSNDAAISRVSVCSAALSSLTLINSSQNEIAGLFDSFHFLPWRLDVKFDPATRRRHLFSVLLVTWAWMKFWFALIKYDLCHHCPVLPAASAGLLSAR